VGTSDGKLIRVDARSQDDPVRTSTGAVDGLAADDSGVWALNRVDGSVTHFDARTLRASDPVELSGDVTAMAVDDEGDLWTLDQSGGVVTNIATRSTVPVGGDPKGIDAGHGSIWVGDTDGILRRIDTTTGEVTEFTVGSPIVVVAIDRSNGSVWVETGSG
jgi:streptogramin lyase